LWSNSEGTLDIDELCEGIYTITVTDDNGCQVTQTFNIIQDNPIEIVPVINNIACNGDHNGSISVSAIGGTGAITYNWTGPGGDLGSGNTISDLGPGAYTLSWQDGACSGDETYNISEASALNIEITTSIYGDYNISTPGGSDGSISVLVTGGSPEYAYDWTPLNDAGNAISGLPAGTYPLTVTDANECKLDTVITLTEPSNIILPTGLSPNGDGFNDFYVIPGVLNCAGNPNFKVFNRWGSMVYESSNYANEWFGQDKSGGLLADGTYFIIFEGCTKELSTYVDLRRQ